MISGDLWPLSHLDEARVSTHDAPGFIVLGLLLVTAGVSLYFLRRSAAARIWFGVALALLAVWGFPWFIAEGEVAWIIPLLLAVGGISLFFARTSIRARICTILVICLLYVAGEYQYTTYVVFLDAKAVSLKQQRQEADHMEQYANAFDRLRQQFDAAELDPKRAAELRQRLEQLAQFGHLSATALRAGAIAWEAGSIGSKAYFKIVEDARSYREDQIYRGLDELKGTLAQAWPAPVRDAYLDNWDSLSPDDQLGRVEIGNQRATELRSLLAVLAVNAVALQGAPELVVDPKAYRTQQASGRTPAVYDVSQMQAAVAVRETQIGQTTALHGNSGWKAEPAAQTTAVTRWPEIVALSNELAGVQTEIAVLDDPRTSERGNNPDGRSPSPEELKWKKKSLDQEELLLEMAVASYAGEKAEGIAVARERNREEEISALTKQLNTVRIAVEDLAAVRGNKDEDATQALLKRLVEEHKCDADPGVLLRKDHLSVAEIKLRDDARARCFSAESAVLEAESTALEEQIAQKHAENPRAEFEKLIALLPNSARSIQKAKRALADGRIDWATFDKVTQQAKSNLNEFDNFIGEPGFHKFLLEPGIRITAGGILFANNPAEMSKLQK